MMRMLNLCVLMLVGIFLTISVSSLAAPEEEGGIKSDAADEQLPAVSAPVSDPVAAVSLPDVVDVRIVSDDTSGYLPPDEFLALYGDDYSVESYALQTTPTSPVTADSANGFKKVILSLFGDYSPVITQYRYQSNTSSNFTYVNDIQLDYPWLTAAAVFVVVLYCCIRMGASFLCKR